MLGGEKIKVLSWKREQALRDLGTDSVLTDEDIEDIRELLRTVNRLETANQAYKTVLTDVLS